VCVYSNFCYCSNNNVCLSLSTQIHMQYETQKCLVKYLTNVKYVSGVRCQDVKCFVKYFDILTHTKGNISWKNAYTHIFIARHTTLHAPCTHICTHTHSRAYTHTYMHVHIYTHTHIQTHPHTFSQHRSMVSAACKKSKRKSVLPLNLCLCV